MKKSKKQKDWDRSLRETKPMTYEQKMFLKDLCKQTGERFSHLLTKEQARFRIAELRQLRDQQQGKSTPSGLKKCRKCGHKFKPRASRDIHCINCIRQFEREKKQRDQEEIFSK
jgi:hypothetical protein